MNPAKIRLSQKEMDLVTNAAIILTKNEILKKAYQLLAQLQEKEEACLMKADGHSLHLKQHIPAKISKGENYQGLPYLVLDYPRVFEKENIFTIRTLFWWGNFFSITLHVSGSFQKIFSEKINAAFSVFQEQGYYYCINKDPWQHHFGEENYQPVSELSPAGFEELGLRHLFIKLAKKVPLDQWDSAETILFNDFKKIIDILKD